MIWTCPVDVYKHFQTSVVFDWLWKFLFSPCPITLSTTAMVSSMKATSRISQKMIIVSSLRWTQLMNNTSQTECQPTNFTEAIEKEVCPLFGSIYQDISQSHWGFAWIYGVSLISGGYFVLFMSLVPHCRRFAFLVFLENPCKCVLGALNFLGP